MRWLNDNKVPLIVGAVVGYVVAKRGGVMGTLNSVKSKAKSV